MNISYEYYKVFYYVAKLGSITGAAEYLLYNQPNVSRTVKLLEKELGCTLFNRSNRGVTLTAQGEKLFEHVKIAVSHIETAENELESEKEINKGVVFVGTTEVALRCFLLPVLNKFRQQYPNVKINLTNYTATQAVKALKEELVDFSVLTTPTGDISGLKAQKVMTVSEVAVCGDYFKELHQGTHTLTELSRYPIITMEKSTKTYEIYRELFLRHKADFSPAIEAATADQIIPMVKNNLGVGFVAKELTAEEKSGVFQVKMKEKLPKRDICVLKKENTSLSFAAKKLHDLILTEKSVPEAQA